MRVHKIRKVTPKIYKKFCGFVHSGILCKIFIDRHQSSMWILSFTVFLCTNELQHADWLHFVLNPDPTIPHTKSVHSSIWLSSFRWLYEPQFVKVLLSYFLSAQNCASVWLARWTVISSKNISNKSNRFNPHRYQ